MFDYSKPIFYIRWILENMHKPETFPMFAAKLQIPMYNVFGMAICNGWKDLGARARDAFKECLEAPIKNGLQGLKYCAISCNNSRALLIKVRKCTKRKEPPQTQCFNSEGNGTWIQSIPQPRACFMTFLTMGSVRYFSSTDWSVSGHVLELFLLIYLYIYI